jgi:hypothetical protein
LGVLVLGLKKAFNNNFLLILLILVLLLFVGLFYYNYEQVKFNNNVLSRIADIHDMRELPILGHAGLFDTKSLTINVSAGYDKTNKQVCMIFLHELGHRIDYMNSPQLFVDKSKEDKELFADNYAYENAWRCEEI